MSSVKRQPPARILVVDDSAHMRIYTRTILESLGFEVVEASDGASAFDLVLASEFDVLVTDLEMKPMTGFELIAAVGLLPSWRRPKIVVCSSSQGCAVRARAELRQVASILEKPVHLQDIAGAVLDALKAKQPRSCGA